MELMDKKLRILILEDVPADAELMERELRKGGIEFSSKRVDTKEAFLNELKAFEPDLILGDYKLPSFDGLSAIRIVQEKCFDVPFIFISGTIGEELAIETLKSGATDYVLKDRLFRLMPAVNRALREVEERTKRKEADEALRKEKETAQKYLDIAGVILVAINADHEVILINKKGCEILGYKEREIIGKDWFDNFLPERMRERTRAVFTKLLAGEIGSVEYFENSILNKRGEERIIAWHNTILRDGNDNIMGTLSSGEDITERKKDEDRLRESEARYRDLIETARDVIFTLSSQGVFTSFNSAFETITGWSTKEWIGKFFVDLLDPNDVPKAIQRFKSVMEGQLEESIELHIRTKYGGVVHGEFVASPQVKEGKVIGVLGIARDITRRKKAEEALRTSEQKYRTILENIEEGYYEVDVAGNFTFFNDSLCQIYGYPREELMGMNDRQYTDQENAKKLFQAFNKVYRTGEPTREFDWEIISKDGTKRSIEASVSLMKDSSGNRIGFRGLIHDITGRKRAEEQLSKLFRAVEQSPATVIITDTDANIEYVNPKFTQLTGYTLGEVIGKNPRILKSGETPPEEYKLLWETITSGREWRGEFHNKKKNGEIYWELASISSIKNPEGLVTHFVAVKEDITERKRAEEERATLQEQLRQSQKMEAIGQLAGGVAHDFNNLLTVIKGYSQLSLNETKESDPLRGNIEEIKKASDRAADLTRQLLAFSRRQIMEAKVLDLNALLQNLDKMLRRIIGEDIELVTSLGENLGTVKADPGQIEQVIINLAVNAKDAMPKGGRLTIETANTELDDSYARAHVAVTPGPYVMIAVSDTGTGMPPEVRDRVFEPFFTTKGKGKGTGLGLSTVYGIVKQSGGNIWIYSESGKGTTLKIYLPRVDEPAEEVKTQAVGEEFPLGSETILIVEDDKEVRNLAVRILKRQGYTVLDGSYGAEAFNACRQHKGPIHLLVTDVVMPGMDGRALSESLSKLHPEMKVLYMSGYTDDAIIRHGVMEKGMNYIQKPFTVNGLTNKVREVLDK